MRYAREVASAVPLLDALLTDAPRAVGLDVQAAFARFEELRQQFPLTFDAATRFGFDTDRLGYAFIGGYSGALRAMVPALGAPAALCVTEAGGGHPRAVQCTLRPDGDGFVLDGEKAFVTFGALAEQLLVVCKMGDRADGTPELALVQIPADRAGIAIAALPATPFAPEIPHAKVTLTAVAVNAHERLRGDGYLDYVKPFRTVEDIHVLGAALGYLVSVARRTGSGADFCAEACALVTSLRALALEPPGEPAVHLALGAIHGRIETLVHEGWNPVWQRADVSERERWQRDRPLLAIASKVRAARFERASAHFALSS